MIDQFNADRSGWARFSDDMVMRFRLARQLDGSALVVHHGDVISAWLRVVFVLLNPSDADAFRPDPTVTNCCTFARRWGMDVAEVVNLNAFRSPYPEDLRARSPGQRGDDFDATEQIVHACRGANLVIAGWGNDGELDGRGDRVRDMLIGNGIRLFHLGLTKGGYPKHPLARGKHRIPADQAPIGWTRFAA